MANVDEIYVFGVNNSCVPANESPMIGNRKPNYWMMLVRFAMDLVLAAVAMIALANVTHLDEWSPAALLTYQPRPVIAIVALVLAVLFIWQLQRVRALVAICSGIVCLACLNWGCPSIVAAGDMAETPSFQVFSMNIHGEPEHLQSYLAWHQLEPDILCLQEMQPYRRSQLEEALPGFAFFSQDTGVGAGGGPHTCLTGIRKSRFDVNSVRIYPSVTAYRTFALEILPKGCDKPLDIVNVHTTKALVFHRGLVGLFTKTPAKSRRHVGERKQLEEWIAGRGHGVLFAGDFNATMGGTGLRLEGTSNAHSVAGQGVLLTFPTAMPVVGIDHVLGSREIEFLNSFVLFDSFSDHCGRIATFRLATTDAESR